MVDLVVPYVSEKVPKMVVTLFPHTQNHTYLIIFFLSFLVGNQDLRRYKPMPLSFFTELP